MSIQLRAAVGLLLSCALLPTVVAAAPAHASPAPGTSPSAASAAADVVPGGVQPVVPHRVLDTRSGTGAPRGLVRTGTAVTLDVTGTAGVPASGVSAVALTVTAVAPTATGWVTVHPHGTTAPATSNLNFSRDATVPNLVLTPVAPDGTIDLTVGGTGASTHLLADVAGYVRSGEPVDPGTVHTVRASRLLDTRTGVGGTLGQVPAGDSRRLVVAGRGGVPATGAGAVWLTVTATRPTASGYVSVTPTAQTSAATSVLNYATVQTRANLVLVPLAGDGSVSLRVGGSGSTDLLADVSGWVGSGTAAGDGGVTAVAPARLLDTRTTPGSSAQDGSVITVPATGRAGVPDGRVSAVVLNVTATAAGSHGYVTAGPEAPWFLQTSNLNFAPGRSVANLVVVPLGPSGVARLAVEMNGGTVDLLVDVAGYVVGQPADTTPPDPVTDLLVTRADDTTFALRWANPTTGDLTGVMLRRKIGVTPPQSPLDGELLADSLATQYVDAGRPPATTFSYAVFAHDGVRNYAGAASGSAHTPGLLWNAPQSVSPYRGAPADVSCPTTTWCMAVDRSGAALTFSGSSWSAPRRVVDPGDDPYAGFTSVSCPTTTYCVAASQAGLSTYANGTWGTPTKPGGRVLHHVECVSTAFCAAASGDGYVAVRRGGAWTTPASLGSGISWFSLSCASASFCVTAGQDNTSDGRVARWNGTSWTKATRVEPSGSSAYAVSCTSTSFCMVTDGAGSYVRWNGTRWTAPVFHGDGEFQARDLSCTSASRCVAYDAGLGVIRWDGTTWSARSTAGFGQANNGAVDCASSSMCMTVEDHGRYRRWNGTSWSAASTFDPTSGGIADLSCGSASRCLLTDTVRNARTWTGSTWSAPVAVANHWTEADCPTASWCLVIEPWTGATRTYSNGVWGKAFAGPRQYGSPTCVDSAWCMSIGADGRVVWGNGSAWGTPRRVFDPYDVYGVTCSTRTSCLAVSGGGRWSAFNGTSWTTPRLFAPDGIRTETLSCASARMCLALGDSGLTFRFDGQAWQQLSNQYDPVTGSGVDLSCPAENFCALLNSDGSISNYTGREWNPVRAPTSMPAGEQMTTIDCPSVHTCVVASLTRAAVSTKGT